MNRRRHHRETLSKAAEHDYRINVKAELKIELLHEKIDQLREREVLSNGGRQDAHQATGAVDVGRTRFGCERRAAVITRGYRLHGVTSFPIRRAEDHASRYVASGNI
jgi:hypothetical protein